MTIKPPRPCAECRDGARIQRQRPLRTWRIPIDRVSLPSILIRFFRVSFTYVVEKHKKRSIKFTGERVKHVLEINFLMQRLQHQTSKQDGKKGERRISESTKKVEWKAGKKKRNLENREWMCSLPFHSDSCCHILSVCLFWVEQKISSPLYLHHRSHDLCCSALRPVHNSEEREKLLCTWIYMPVQEIKNSDDFFSIKKRIDEAKPFGMIASTQRAIAT